MITRRVLLAGGLIGLSACSFATAPVFMGQVNFKSVAYTANDGSFEWKVLSSTTSLFTANTNVFTYCMSLNNLFSPSETQTYDVYGIAGASALDIQSSGILGNNNMAGLTPTHFVEAAAQAQSFGVLNGITATDDLHNQQIHTTEAVGDNSFDSMDYSRFFYLQQDNSRDNQYAGQPQGWINPVPEPASMAMIGLGVVSVLRRRKKA